MTTKHVPFVEPPAPPADRSGVGSPAEKMDLTVQELTQHVHQHNAEPRDFDYRVQAFAFALSLGAEGGVNSAIWRAGRIEEYLRNGNEAAA